MSNISVPSRFACLNIEGEDEQPKRIDKKQVKPKKNDKTDKNRKPQIKQKKEKPQKIVSEKQWEEWKQKDEELVNDNFEAALQNAILLSKLDYEERKGTFSKTEEEPKKAEKKKKTVTMSLDQFLGNYENSKENVTNSKQVKNTDKSDFFGSVEDELKQELTKEKLKEKTKSRQANIEEIITASQYQEKLQLEILKNEELERQIESLKLEVASVKSRNHTLCKILGHGEMKEKADVLIELERLNTVKNELTDEVAKLHVLLEQERSKVAALNAEKVKDKKNKRHA